jgi:hypothetical protein
MEMIKQSKPNRGFWTWLLGGGWANPGSQG